MSSSSISSSSHHSSVSSSTQRAKIQMANNLREQTNQAIRDYHLLEKDYDRQVFLISKVHLFAKDKSGCSILQNKINEEV